MLKEGDLACVICAFSNNIVRVENCIVTSTYLSKVRLMRHHSAIVYKPDIDAAGACRSRYYDIIDTEENLIKEVPEYLVHESIDTLREDMHNKIGVFNKKYDIIVEDETLEHRLCIKWGKHE
jgi:hypothetical protein